MLGKYFVCFIILLLTSVRISPVILGSVSCKFSYDIQFHTLLYDWQLHKKATPNYYLGQWTDKYNVMNY